MISREQFAGEILDLLGELFIDQVASWDEDTTSLRGAADEVEAATTSRREVKHLKPSNLLLDLSDQVTLLFLLSIRSVLFC